MYLSELRHAIKFMSLSGKIWGRDGELRKYEEVFLMSSNRRNSKNIFLIFTEIKTKAVFVFLFFFFFVFFFWVDC